MARVTVEDCVEVVPNRFELVLFAAQRARAIEHGAPITVMRDNDKNTVVALREIAKKSVSTNALHEELIKKYQKLPSSQTEEEETREEMLDESSEEALLSQLKNSADVGASAFDDREDEDTDFNPDDLEAEEEEEEE